MLFLYLFMFRVESMQLSVTCMQMTGNGTFTIQLKVVTG